MRRDEGRDRPSRGRSSVQLVMGDGANCCDLSYLDLPLFTRWIYIYIYVFRVMDLSIHTGMWRARLCAGINVKVLYICVYKYRFRFVVG